MSIERYKNDVEKLLQRGRELLRAMIVETHPEAAKKLSEERLEQLPDVRAKYQSWYSESLAAVTQLLPDRVDDFVSYYKPRRDAN